MADMEIVRATRADVSAIMTIERLPGYDALVGSWEEARHLDILDDPRHAVFVARRGGAIVGFAILRDWDAPERTTLLRRIAIANPDRGDGRALLRALMARVFGETRCHRLHLGLFPHNLRARRAYEAAGFVAEGVSRGSAYFGGEHRDELVMAILRPEWEARET